MGLKQKTVSETLPGLPEPSSSGDGSSPEKRGYRWMGLMFVALGALAMAFAMALAPGTGFEDALAGSDGGDDTLRGTENGERLGGFAGDDGIHGLRGDDALFGGEGGDEIYGGPGRDVMLGGAGDDFIEAKDGGRDYVDCGPGEDVASVDGGRQGDRVAPNCETVYPG